MGDALGKLVLRLGLGAMMIPHGWAKLSNLISTRQFSFLDPIGIGVEASLLGTIFAEFFCATLIVLGYKTKLASIPLAFTMLVAAVIVHAEDPFAKKEFALLYFTGFVALLLLGGGKYSLDHWVSSKKYE